jgi:hypothetical protein
MTPPPDYEVNEISYEEAIQDIYDMVGEIDRKLNRMMLWCAGVAITLAVCMFKLFIS